MKEGFYKDRLTQGGIKVVLPNENEMKFINKVIFDELCLGKISVTSRERFLQIISNLGKNGAKGVILGCTEIGLLITQKDTNIKIFDTTTIHINEAVDLALPSE